MNKNLKDFKKLRDIVQQVKTAMLTTVAQDGTLTSRPMMLQEMDENGGLWFFTSLDCEKTKALQTAPRVNLTFSSTEKAHYVSISGEATVIRDQRKTKELWNSLNLAWFPEGTDDPNLVLLRIIPQSAEYWDAPYGKVVQFLGLVKAVVTGKQYNISPGEHGRL